MSNKFNLGILNLFLLLVLMTSVHAKTFDVTDLQFSQDEVIVDEDIVEGCDNKPTSCYPKNFKETSDPHDDFESTGEGCVCNEGTCQKVGADYVCKDDSSECICYREKSKGKCYENTACEGVAITKASDFPCECGKGSGIYTSTEKPYCFEELKFVGTQSQCSLIESCSDNPVCTSQGGSCVGLPCGSGGKCTDSGVCETPGKNLCEQIPGAKCIDLDAGFYIDSACAEQLESGDSTGADCSRLAYSHILKGYIPYPGGTKQDGIRFPSSSELSSIDWESVEGTSLYDLKDDPTYIKFQSRYLPTSSGDLFGTGQGSQFRMQLCGAPANNPGRTAIWSRVCGVIQTSACYDLNLVDAVFGNAQMDPLAEAIWDKTGIGEGYSKWADELTADWNVGDMLGGDWGEAAKGYTNLICKLNLRDKYTEDSTSKIETRKEDDEVVLMINGQKSPLLPNNKTLYEISWMIFNVQGTKSDSVPKDFNYSVYAYDDAEGKYKYAFKDGVKMNGTLISDGATASGYYAFYFNDTYPNGYLDFEFPCIKHSLDPTPYCPQEFIPETYGGTYEGSTPPSGGGSGGSDVSAGESSNEV